MKRNLIRILRVLTVLSLAAFVSTAQDNHEALAVRDIEGGHVSDVTFQKLVTHYQCYGYAAEGWTFISANVSGSSYWSALHTENMTLAEAPNVPLNRAPELFPARLYGEIVKKGPKPGPVPTYLIRMHGGMFYIHSGEEFVRVISQWGDDVPFTAEGGEDPVGWTVVKNDPGDGNIPGPLPAGRNLIIGKIGKDGENPVAPGEYTVSATDANSRFDEMLWWVLKVDLDVDSNNDGIVEPDNMEEDDIEFDVDIEKYPGNILQVNDADRDEDGIKDYVDFEIRGEGFDNPIFKEAILRVEGPVTDDDLVGLVYDDSPPPPMEGGKLRNGILRLWISQSGEARDPKSLKDGGDFIASSEYYNPATWYTVGELFGPGKRKRTLYMEAVRTNANQDLPTVPITLILSNQKDSPVEYSAEDKARVMPVKIDIAMDGNRDGSINFNDPKDKKYLFWVNDDRDVSEYWQTEFLRMEDDIQGPPDCDDDTIGYTSERGKTGCKRDLEDFTRLHIAIPRTLSRLEGISYHFVMEGGCQANIFEAAPRTKDDLYGNSDYLTLTEVAEKQIEIKRLLTISSAGSEIAPDLVKPDGKRTCFLLEGKKAGKGQIMLIVKNGDNHIASQGVKIELRPPEEFYEKYVVTMGENGYNVNSDFEKVQEPAYEPDKNDYLLYVHGWNMSEWEKDRWAETVFKRMWWQGYKGHVGIFSWPTLTANWTGIPGPWNYDNSEQRAWNSAAALDKLLKHLNKNHSNRVRILAHSMGNVVAGEALRTSTGKVAHTYFATQAAISANCYDNSKSLDNPEFTSYKTPNIYGFYTRGKKPDKPYLIDVPKRTNKIVRLFNEDDWALDWWDSNNEMKPDFDYDYWGSKDSYHQSNDLNKKDVFYINNIWPFPNDILLFEENRFEIFSFCLESRSRALGAVTHTIFSEECDLMSLGYNDHHYSHSRQFRSNIVDERGYWDIIYSKGEF